MKVLVVGAGVAGLSIAWRLAQRGIEVEILERGIAGWGATWASAGMIAPGAERRHESGALVDFALNARAQWTGFAKDLQVASAQSISYVEVGSLIVAQSADRARALEAQAASDPAGASWLSAERLREREPLLSPALFGGLFLGGDAQVDNRALADALCIACANAGVTLRERCDVRSLAIRDKRAWAAVTAQGEIEADRIVLACGAWMNLIGGIGPGDLPPIKPAKGQMLACEPLPGVTLPHTPIWGEDVYLVPRNTRLFVGATVEDASFDTSISREVRDYLLGAATRIIPSLCEWRVVEMWAGLRPRSPDNAPVLGVTGVDGLYVASGQFRNGILFAPAIADTLVRLILGDEPGSTLDAFDPRRFIVSR